MNIWQAVNRPLIIALMCGATWAAPKTFETFGVTFQSDLAWSSPARAGLNCQLLQAGDCNILHYLPTTDEMAALRENKQDVGRYFRSTFLGLNPKQMPEQINKVVLGKKGGRHLVFHGSDSPPTRTDIYERDLPDGRTSFFAIRTSSESADSNEQARFRGDLVRSLKYPQD